MVQVNECETARVRGDLIGNLTQQIPSCCGGAANDDDLSSPWLQPACDLKSFAGIDCNPEIYGVVRGSWVGRWFLRGVSTQVQQGHAWKKIGGNVSHADYQIECGVRILFLDPRGLLRLEGRVREMNSIQMFAENQQAARRGGTQRGATVLFDQPESGPADVF